MTYPWFEVLPYKYVKKHMHKPVISAKAKKVFLVLIFCFITTLLRGEFFERWLSLSDHNWMRQRVILVLPQNWSRQSSWLNSFELKGQVLIDCYKFVHFWMSFTHQQSAEITVGFLVYTSDCHCYVFKISHTTKSPLSLCLRCKLFYIQ